MMVDFKKLMKNKGIEPKPKPKPFHTLCGVRFNCVTGKPRCVQCEVFVEDREDGSKAVSLGGGVTGYESFLVSGYGVGGFEAVRDHGWHACAGTDGSWDMLYFHQLQMRKLLDKLGV